MDEQAQLSLHYAVQSILSVARQQMDFGFRDWIQLATVLVALFGPPLILYIRHVMERKREAIMQSKRKQQAATSLILAVRLASERIGSNLQRLELSLRRLKEKREGDPEAIIGLRMQAHADLHEHLNDVRKELTSSLYADEEAMEGFMKYANAIYRLEQEMIDSLKEIKPPENRFNDSLRKISMEFVERLLTFIPSSEQ
ncbi:hypothetical protein [Ferrimonas sp. SCSIO 43195]|uniref:hypothetical protein n=1 Tax=Ferrimonas sp. SCSIO 43195 TaxID=2822844 RepID=UPI002074D0CA|nr:hypothetical protein [Ferrimonas sp. SCSIO 43195]USD36466.1 hypothetical protein J8Z22_15780 [Ferrimonas sp. SCSIO 43195]